MLTKFPIIRIEWICLGHIALIFSILLLVDPHLLQRHHGGGIVDEIEQRCIAPPQGEIMRDPSAGTDGAEEPIHRSAR